MLSGRIHGIPQLKAKLAQTAVRVEAVSPKATGAGAGIVANEMKSKAPRRSGKLAASISVQQSSSLGEGATTSVGSNVPYDRFVQFGTVNMEPQAYGEEAADSVSGAVAAAMGAIYKAALT